MSQRLVSPDTKLGKETQGQYTCNKSLQGESNGDSHPQIQKSQLWDWSGERKAPRCNLTPEPRPLPTIHD